MLTTALESLAGDEYSLLELITQTAPDAIITADAEGLILSFSPAAERIFGYAPDEVIGRNVACLMPEPYRAQHDGYMDRYYRTGERRIIGIGRQVRGQRKDGTLFDAELAIGEHAGPDGRIFTGFIRDVSDRVEAIRRMGTLQRELEKVSRSMMLGELSTALAHEINQPLTAISNYARTCQRKIEQGVFDRETALDCAEKIALQAQRAGDIIRRMQRLVDRGTVDLRPEDVNEVLVEAIRYSQIRTLHPGIRLTLEFAPELPKVLADRVQVQQVVINLLRNAAEAIDGEEGHEVRITSALRPAEGSVRVCALRNDSDEILVSVADDGPGFPEHLRQVAFDPFCSGKAQGMGVGLAICRTIVEAHGGRIWADTAPGGGAVVHFTLRAAGQE